MAAIVQTEGVMGGQPRLDGHRISVLQIHEWVVEEGASPASVAESYDLAVADVYRALTYYYDNVEQMRALNAERQQALREGVASQPMPADFDTGAETGG